MSEGDPSPERRIVVFGGSDYGESSATFQTAEHLGRAIAERGWTVANGGYGGTMLAAARGAAGAGGRVIGVTCSIFRSEPNPYLTEVIETADLHARLQKLIELGDAYIVMPGSTGTLAELALVWELVNKQLLAERPILCWGDFWRPVVDVFSRHSTRDPHVAAPRTHDRRGELIDFVETPAQAIGVLDRRFNSANPV